MNKPTLWKTAPSHAEGAEYEGEYRGTMIRVTRLTDFNVWPGRNPTGEKDPTTTRWDGYVADGMDGLRPHWSLVAEFCQTRREALDRLVRYIDRQLS
jgi:hypothetical protein